MRLIQIAWKQSVMLVPCGSELPNRAVPRPQTETPLPAPRLDPWHRGAGTEQAEEPPPQCPGRCRSSTAGRTPEDVTVPIPRALDTRAGVQPCAKCIYHALLGPSPAPSPARCPLGHTLGYSSAPHLPLCTTPGWMPASSFPELGRTGCHGVGAQGTRHPGTGKPPPHG